MQENMEIKILLVYKDYEDNTQIESIQAEQEGEFYRIKNIPFFAPNISYNDLVSVENDNGVFYFEELIQESGHSTLQLVFFSENHIKSTLESLLDFGCDWEGSHQKNYFSVDVPKSVNYSIVKSHLDKGLAEKLWDYKEACLSSKHKNTRT